MITFLKARYSADSVRSASIGSPLAGAMAGDWLHTERDRRAMEDTLNRAAKRAEQRRFNGAPLTGFGQFME